MGFGEGGQIFVKNKAILGAPKILLISRSKYSVFFSKILSPKYRLLIISPLVSNTLWTPLEIVTYLMDQNIQTEPRNIYDVTPLHAAALENHLNVIKFLMTRCVLNVF